MEAIRKNAFRTFAAILLAAVMVLAPAAVLPEGAYAESESTAAPMGLWVVPEIISGARQPASGGMFAWVAFDYQYEGTWLYKDLSPSDFMLQKKLPGGEWTDVPGNNIVILGGYDYYIASYEAIVAAKVPDNSDPVTVKWRVVFEPTDLESEIIVQGADLQATEDIEARDLDSCTYYKVEKAAWSYEQYQKDKVPPIYVAYTRPDVYPYLNDTSLVKSGEHKIVMPFSGSWGGIWDMNGLSIDPELVPDVKLYLGNVAGEGDTEDPENPEDPEAEAKDDGIAALVQDWKDAEENGMWPGSGEIPEAEDVYAHILGAAYVPDEDADEYIRADITSSYVFWVSGAGTQENVDRGVTDYILVVINDWTAPSDERHDWGEPAWEWTGNDADGYTAASVTFTCKNKDARKKKIDAEVTYRAEGINNIYTAEASFEGAAYKDEKVIEAEGADEIEKTINAAKNELAKIDTLAYSGEDKDAVDAAIAEAAARIDDAVSAEEIKAALEDARTALAEAKTNESKISSATEAVAAARTAAETAQETADQSKVAAEKAASVSVEEALSAARKAKSDAAAAKAAADEYSKAANEYKSVIDEFFDADSQEAKDAKREVRNADKQVKLADQSVLDAEEILKTAVDAKAAADRKAADEKARKVKTVTVNASTVSAKAINDAVKKAGGSEKYVTKIVLGKKVKKISAKAFAKYKKVTTVELKTKKLSKKSVKGSLKGSKIKTIRVKAGSKKVNKKILKKYKKFFTKSNAGKKVKIK